MRGSARSRRAAARPRGRGLEERATVSAGAAPAAGAGVLAEEAGKPATEHQHRLVARRLLLLRLPASPLCGVQPGGGRTTVLRVHTVEDHHL